MTRCRLAVVLVLTCVLAGAGSGSAAARDMCFTLPGVAGFVEFALKDFTIPATDRCKSVVGFSRTTGWLLEGAACKTADATTLRLAFAGHPLVAGPTTFQGGCAIPLPSLTGGSCRGTFGVNPTQGFTSSISLSICTASVP